MKKVFLILLTISMLLSSVYAVSDNVDKTPDKIQLIKLPYGFSSSSVDDIVDLYTSYRADTLVKNKKTVSIQSDNNIEKSSDDGLKTINSNTVFSNTVINDELKRSDLIKDMEKRLKLKIVDSSSETKILNRKDSNDKVTIECYIITYFRYVDESVPINSETIKGATDLSAFGTEHTLVFQRKNNEYKLISDQYDEGPLTNMKSSGYTAESSETDIDINQEDTVNNQVEQQMLPMAINVAGYNMLKAIGYSNEYALSYNPNFKSYKDEGGDCANFVSQCIDDGSYGKWRSNQWKPYTDTWVSSTKGLNFYVSQWGATKIINPTASQLKVGCPVYYNWKGTSTSVFQHAALCVQVDMSGVPVVNSHTHDYYHIRWNYGGKNCKYATVLLW